MMAETQGTLEAEAEVEVQADPEIAEPQDTAPLAPTGTIRPAIGLIYERIARIMKEMPAIGKQRSGGLKYDFRSIDRVYDVLHGLLVKHGVFFTPHVESQDREVLPRFDKQTGKQIGHTVLTCLLVKYRLYCAEDGSIMEVGPFPGEAADAGDKASAKAMSLALKGVLLQTFCIPIQAEAGWQPGEDGGGGDVESKVKGFLDKKANGKKANGKAPANGNSKTREQFMAGMQELAVRDLNGYPLSVKDCGDLYHKAKGLSGLTSGKEVAAWIRDNATLGVEVDQDSGEVVGVELTVNQ